jgi:hypothetical protein
VLKQSAYLRFGAEIAKVAGVRLPADLKPLAYRARAIEDPTKRD